MNRRKFLQDVALWSAGFLLSPPIFNITPGLFASAKKTKLVVAEGINYDALVENLLRPLGGISAFVKPGKNVVIKPNMGWDRSPDQAANTHPLIVRSLAELALEAGASKVMIFDRPL